MAISITTAQILLQLQLDSSKTDLVESLRTGCIQEALDYTNQDEDDVEDNAGFINAIITYIGSYVANPNNLASEKFDTYSVAFGGGSNDAIKSSIFKSYRLIKFV